MNFTTELDHIVIACNPLDEGRAWCKETLGVEATGGGKHSGIGTHNTLLSLGPKQYLEIIAIDPDGDAPAFPRWFGLDTEEVKNLIAHGPKLVAWVARTAPNSSADAIEQLARVEGNAANIVRPAARGDFRWRFAFTQAGARPRGDVMPHFIQWDVPSHPCDRLPDVGVRLTSLMLGDPEPETVSASLANVHFLDATVQIAQSTSRHLVAMLSTPRGGVVIE